MTVIARGKLLIGAGLVLGIGIALSACAAPVPGADYAGGYYGDPGYYDYGDLDSFGFVGRDRDHDRRHDHDHDGDGHGMHDDHATIVSHSFAGERGFVAHNPGAGPGFASRGFGGQSGFVSHGFGGGFAGGHGGGGGRR
jgi:hypothetical protein